MTYFDEIEEHVNRAETELQGMTDADDLRSLSLILLDSIRKITKHAEKSPTTILDGRVAVTLHRGLLASDIGAGLAEIVDAPEACQKVLYHATRLEPEESCQNWAVAGSEFCEEHL